MVLGCGGKPAEPPALPVAPVATVVPAEPEPDEPEVEAVEPEPEPEPVEPVDAGPPARTERPPMPGPCDLRPGEFSKVPCNPPTPAPATVVEGKIYESRSSAGGVRLTVGMEGEVRYVRGDRLQVRSHEVPGRAWEGLVLRAQREVIELRINSPSAPQTGRLTLQKVR